MSTRPIFDIINITMTRLTTTVTRQGFGASLILANFDTTLTRVTTVSKASYATTLSGLGLDSSSAAYAAFTDHFAQEPSPNTAYLGRVQSTRQDITITADDVATTYTINVNTPLGATPYSSVGQGTPAATATALAALVNANAYVSAIGSGADVQITLLGTQDVITTGTVAGGAGTIDATPSNGTTEDLDDALTACKSESSNWYGICGAGTQGRLVAQQKLAADWAESNDRLYICATADNNCRDMTYGAPDNDTATSIAGYCKSQAMKNTAVIFHGSAATEYLDAAWMGRCLPKDPGAINWNQMTLSSVTVDTTHTPTYRTNMGDKGCSWYESLAGRNATQVGTGKAQNGYGDFIDLTRLSAALKFGITENIIDLLQVQDKVPFTNKGIAMVRAEIQERLEYYKAPPREAVASYTISVPDAADVATASKATRSLPSVNFTAVASGAINDVTIAGTVSVS